MKKMLFLLTVILSVGCSKNKVDKTKDLNVDFDKVKQQQEKAVRDQIQKTIEENRIATCEAEEKKPGFLGRVKNGFLGLFRTEGFDIIFPKDLTEKINTEILDSIFANMDFRPTDFWNTLSADTANELNEFLIDKYFEADDEEYKRVRDMAAFLFLFHFQMEKRSPGYELFLEEQDVGISKIKVAFDESAIYADRRKLSFCEKVSYLSADFKTDSVYKKPSDIAGKVICTRGVNKVEIVQAASKEVGTFFKIMQEGMSEPFNFTVKMPRDADIDPRSDAVEMSMYIKKLLMVLDIEIKRKKDYNPRSVINEYKPNSFSRMTLKGTAGDIEFDMKNLVCEERKEVTYQLE